MNRIIILLCSGFACVAVISSSAGKPPLTRSISKIFFNNAQDDFVAVDIEQKPVEQDDSSAIESESDDTEIIYDGWVEQKLSVPTSPIKNRLNSPSDSLDIPKQGIALKDFAISISEPTSSE